MLPNQLCVLVFWLGTMDRHWLPQVFQGMTWSPLWGPLQQSLGEVYIRFSLVISRGFLKRIGLIIMMIFWQVDTTSSRLWFASWFCAEYGLSQLLALPLTKWALTSQFLFRKYECTHLKQGWCCELMLFLKIFWSRTVEIEKMLQLLHPVTEKERSFEDIIHLSSFSNHCPQKVLNWVVSRRNFLRMLGLISFRWNWRGIFHETGREPREADSQRRPWNCEYPI